MNMIFYTRWFALWSLTLFLMAGLMAGVVVPEVFAQDEEQKPLFWRQFIPGSATTRAMFLSRSAQLVLYRNGMVIYQGDRDMPYQQVMLSKNEFIILVGRIEAEYHLSVVTPERLKNEEPYIKSVQKSMSGNDVSSVVMWFGIHRPPSLFRYPAELLKARSGNIKLGPAWDSLYRYSQYLSTFHHPRAKPLVPDRIEIAVQPLPSYLSDAADSAVAWPLADVALREVQGARKRGFHTLTGDAARLAYKLLSTNSVVSDAGVTYLVWARPLLLPDKK